MTQNPADNAPEANMPAEDEASLTSPVKEGAPDPGANPNPENPDEVSSESEAPD